MMIMMDSLCAGFAVETTIFDIVHVSCSYQTFPLKKTVTFGNDSHCTNSSILRTLFCPNIWILLCPEDTNFLQSTIVTKMMGVIITSYIATVIFTK